MERFRFLLLTGLFVEIIVGCSDPTSNPDAARAVWADADYGVADIGQLNGDIDSEPSGDGQDTTCDGCDRVEPCDGLDNDGDGLIDNNPTDPEIGMCRGRRRSKWRQ